MNPAGVALMRARNQATSALFHDQLAALGLHPLTLSRKNHFRLSCRGRDSDPYERGVYVRSVSRFTPIYMALIDPFRKLVVYPSLLRTIRAKWNKTFGTA